MNKKHVFVVVLGEKINFFAIFTSEDGEQLLCSNFLIFLVLCKKCPEDAEDAKGGELCRYAPPYSVRCPLSRFENLGFTSTIYFCFM